MKILFCFWLEVFYLFFSKWSFIHNVVLTLPNVVKIVVEKGNIHKTDVHKVVSTIIWRCATSPHHINLKTTLKQRWNNVEMFVGLSILDAENHVNSFQPTQILKRQQSCSIDRDEDEDNIWMLLKLLSELNLEPRNI